uniref:ANK_REP_REGION domain-containing protein n=1 Tax=Panagrellus redivivus TaxID=6233 RepID=A0A7E4VPD8_PANRE
MDPTVYQKYTYVNYHLKSLLRSWKQLKPNFEAKITTVSPIIKLMLIQSLVQIKKRILEANLKLVNVNDYLHLICTIHHLDSIRTDLLYKPNMGADLCCIAWNTISDIDLLRHKIEGIQTIPFQKLPYEFQSRLVALLPPRDAGVFKVSGKTALKSVNQRGMFATTLIIARNDIDYENIKKAYGGNTVYDILSTKRFLNSAKCYVRTGLCINMDSVDKFDSIVNKVFGVFCLLELQGRYTWRHAIQFMNISKNVRYVYLKYGMQLEVDDFDEFFEAVVQVLCGQKDVLMVVIHCPHLDLTFEQRIKQCVENRTSFDVVFPIEYLQLDIMDPTLYQKYTYVDYHLKALLRAWKQLKPQFEAKLASKILPTVKPILLQSLVQIRKRILEANLKLVHLNDYLYVICTIYRDDSLRTNLHNKPNTGVHLCCTAWNIISDIDLLRDKFEDIQPVPFQKLPYEFQSRLVALLSPRDLVAFKISGKTALNNVDRRGMFASTLVIARNNINYENIKKVYGGNTLYDILSTKRFLASEMCYVSSGLCINMDSIDKFDRSVNLVCGIYCLIELQGQYTWRHAIHLMNTSKNVRYVCLKYGMQLEVDNFEEFFEAVVKFLGQQKDVLVLDIHCPHLDVTFEQRMKAYVEDRTNFDVIFPLDCLVIYKLPKLCSA